MQPFNHPENKGDTSLHPCLSHTIVLIIFIKWITLNIMTKVNVLVFHFFTARTKTSVWRHWEWRHTVWRHVAAFFLLGLCEKDCSINMLNFNKLRFIVYEIFDNSQLFLTDPRITSPASQEPKSCKLSDSCLWTCFLQRWIIAIRDLSSFGRTPCSRCSQVSNAVHMTSHHLTRMNVEFASLIATYNTILCI